MAQLAPRSQPDILNVAWDVTDGAVCSRGDFSCGEGIGKVERGLVCAVVIARAAPRIELRKGNQAGPPIERLAQSVNKKRWY